MSDSFAFLLLPNGSVTAYALESGVRVVNLPLPVARPVSMRLTRLDAALALLTVLAADARVVQIEVSLRDNALAMEVRHCWALGGAATVADYCSPARGVALVALADGSVLRCVGDEAVTLECTSALWLPAPPPSDDEGWRLLCHELYDDRALVPDTVFPQLAARIAAGFGDLAVPLDAAQVREAVCAYAAQSLERGAVARMINECVAQFRACRFLTCSDGGVAVAVCGGGLALVQPLPPPVAQPARLASLLALLCDGVAPTHWAEFDAECARGSPEEASLALVRAILTTSDVGVRVAQRWAVLRLGVGDLVAAAEQALRIAMMWQAGTVTADDLDQLRQAHTYLAGPVVAHAAAWALRQHADTVYGTLRALLALALLLLHTHSGTGIRSVVSALTASVSRVARLRHATRVPGLWTGVALTAAAVFRRLQLAPDAPVSAPHLLCVSVAQAALSDPPLLLMRALYCAQQWEALARLAGSGQHPACLHYAATCRLHRGDGAGALAGFMSALHAGLTDDPEVVLKLAAGVNALEPLHAPDQYWLAVMMEFERTQQLEWVVKTARVALRGSQHPHVFWVASFRHNLLLKRYAEAYMDVQGAHCSARVASALTSCPQRRPPLTRRKTCCGACDCSSWTWPAARRRVRCCASSHLPDAS